MSEYVIEEGENQLRSLKDRETKKEADKIKDIDELQSSMLKTEE